MKKKFASGLCAALVACCGVFADEVALPEGYTRLAWIESTGEQHIDTGVNAGTNTTIDLSFGHAVDVQATERSLAGTFFGKNIWDPKGFLFILQNDRFRFFGANGSEPGAAWNILDKDVSEERDYRFVLGADNTARMFDAAGNELAALPTERTVTSDHSLWLFKANHRYSQYGQFRLYAMTIGTDAGETLRDFVPARRVADGIPGLYDRVSNSFFTNPTGAPFLGSDDVCVATWTGAGDGTNLASAANWECRDGNGALVANAIPNRKTTVKITTTSFPSVPAGTTWPYGKIQFGAVDHPLTEWGRIGYGIRYNGSDMPNYDFVDIALGAYTWKGGQAGIVAELDDYSTSWMGTNLKQSQLRFDGWVNVDAAHAGEWSMLLCFDDYFHLTIDGTEIAKILTYRYATNYTAKVSAGWHRFTCIAGDCWGGYGSLRWSGTKWSGPGKSYGPMTITSGAQTFKFSQLEEGTGENRLTLTQDVDWRGLGLICLANAQKIDLAGHKLYLAGFATHDPTLYYLGAEITDSVGGGELHLESASSFSNDSIRFTGALKLVKEGTGNFTSSCANQTYTGGTEIVAGTFTLGNNTCLGAVSNLVQIGQGATLEVNAVGEIDKYRFVLAGGTIQNTRGDVSDYFAQISNLRLTADSTFKSTRNYGLIGWGYVATSLDLAGHTLTVEAQPAKRFWLYNATVTAGTIVMTGGGWLAVNKTAVTAPETVFRLDYAALEVYVPFTVGTYEASYACDWNLGVGVMTVKTRFKPVAEYHRGVVLENGATLDLSAQSEAWPCKGEKAWGACTFAENAVIQIDVGSRTLHANDYLVTWTEDEVPPTSTRFELAPGATASKWYVVRTSVGLCVGSGMLVIFR